MARGRGKLTPHELEAMEVVSNNLQKILFEKNLKQSQIADALNIPRSTFNDYIKGNTLPIPGNIQKIADYFGLLNPTLTQDLLLRTHLPLFPLRQKLFLRP